jgi:hypothetical protein
MRSEFFQRPLSLGRGHVHGPNSICASGAWTLPGWSARRRCSCPGPVGGDRSLARVGRIAFVAEILSRDAVRGIWTDESRAKLVEQRRAT